MKKIKNKIGLVEGLNPDLYREDILSSKRIGSDIGLLKEDSSPAMPGMIESVWKNK
jgi:hypothetical protein